MAPATSTKLTYEDYCLLPDDGRRHEIIDGEHYVNPAPNVRHQRIVRRLLMTLATFAEERNLGEVFCSPIDVVLSENNVVQPDVLFIRNDAGRADGAFVEMTPDLVVEVLSVSNRRHDEVRKRKLYDQFNVQEYWIVDPEDEVINVYRRQTVGLTLVEKVEMNGKLTSPLLPGLKLVAKRVLG